MTVSVRSCDAWRAHAGSTVYIVRWVRSGGAVAEQSCECLGVWTADELRRAAAEQKRKQSRDQSGDQE